MPAPIILLCGTAGSGKDTLAGFMTKKLPGSQVMGFADALKQAVDWIFPNCFTAEQLFGPSEKRNELVHVPSELLTSLFYRAAGYLGHHTGDVQRFEGPLSNWVVATRREHGQCGALSARYILQTFGTDVCRKVDKDFWANIALRNAQDLLSGGFKYSREKGLEEVVDAAPPPAVIITDGRFPNEAYLTKRLGGQLIKVVRKQSSLDGTAAERHSSETSVGAIPDFWFDEIVHNDSSLVELEDTAGFLLAGPSTYSSFVLSSDCPKL